MRHGGAHGVDDLGNGAKGGLLLALGEAVLEDALLPASHLFHEPGPPRPGVGVDVVLRLRGGLAASDRESGAARQRWPAPRR